MARFVGASLLASLLVAACAGGVPTQPPSTGPALRPSLAPSPSSAAAQAGGRIAFVRQLTDDAVDLFIADSDGSNLVRLTNGGGAEHGLIWAPDGTRLFYESQSPEVCGDSYCFPTRLFSIRPDGTDPRDLGLVGPGPDDWDARGAVSPDGRFAAYGDNMGMGGRIVIADLTISTTRKLALSAPDPIWSPDGSRLLVYALDQWVGVLDAASGKFVVKSADPLVQGIVGWTADGGSIVYQRCDGKAGKQSVIACLAGPPWIAQVKSGGLTPVQSTQAIPAGVAIPSPDGTRSATMLDDGLHVGVAGEPGPLITPVSWVATAGVQLPTWSPDGRWIAYAGGEQQSAISIIAATGGAPTVLGPGYDPAWQPAPGSDAPPSSSSAPSTPAQSAAPTAVSCPGGSVASDGLPVLGLAVVTVETLNVRIEPCKSAKLSYPLSVLRKGAVVLILGKPVASEGYRWYPVALDDGPLGSPPVAWVAAGTASDTWLRPTTHFCPEPNFATIVALSPIELVACYGSRSLSFTAHQAAVPPDAGFGGACGDDNPGTPDWLWCWNINYNFVNADGGPGGPILHLFFDPAKGITPLGLAPVGTTGPVYQIRGHFHDPAAKYCNAGLGSDTLEWFEVWVTCETEFVVEDLRLSP